MPTLTQEVVPPFGPRRVRNTRITPQELIQQGSSTASSSGRRSTSSDDKSRHQDPLGTKENNASDASPSETRDSHERVAMSENRDPSESKGRPSLPFQQEARKQFDVEVRRIVLQQCVDKLLDTSALWTALVNARHRPSAKAKKDETSKENSNGAATESTNGTETSKKPTAASEKDEDAIDYDHLRISYKNYKLACTTTTFGPRPFVESVDAFLVHPLLSPHSFAEFERDANGCIDIVALFSFIAKKTLLYNLRCRLELYSTVSSLNQAVADRVSFSSPTTTSEIHGQESCDDATNGRKGFPASASATLSDFAPPTAGETSSAAAFFEGTEVPRLTVDDVEQFLGDVLSHLRIVRDCAPWMVQYYLCYAAAKFMFQLDPLRLGSISIDSILTSDALSELLVMYENDASASYVPFPIGCPVEIPTPGAVADEHGEVPLTLCTVEEYENGGTKAHDRYILKLPAAAREEKMGDADPKHGKDGDSENEKKDNDTAEGAASASDTKDSDKDRTEGNDVPTKKESNGAASTEGPRQDEEEGLIELPRECLHYPTGFSAFDHCPEMAQLLLESCGPGSETNWFALPVMHRVYHHFSQLDKDCDGMLTEAEMLQYNNASFTTISIKRVFHTHVTGYGNTHMDFKRFLDFVLATEYPSLKASIKYFWTMLDVHETHDYISIDVLRFFAKEISERLESEGLMQIAPDSILAEVVDMINPRAVDRVTLKDVQRSGQAFTVLPILLDFRCFYNYDRREQAAAQAATASTDGTGR